MVDFGSLGLRIILIVVIFIVLVVGGLMAYFFFIKGGKKFKFLLASKDGKTLKELTARVKADSANLKKKVFVFDNGNELIIKEANFFVGGKSYRLIGHTPDGDYTYINEWEISQDKYLKFSLAPEDKQLALYRMKENNIRFQDPLAKNTLMMMTAMLVLTLLLTMGIIFSVYQYAKISGTHVDLAKENNKIMEGIRQSVNTMGDVSERLVTVTAVLSKDYNITRIVS